MIEPKNFYRKLDILQSRIGLEKSGKDYLLTIITELQNIFGGDLKITNGSIYERVDNEYILFYRPTTEKTLPILPQIPNDSEVVQLILKSKTYIFNSPVFYNPEDMIGMTAYITHVAFTVHSQANRWIVVFDLLSEWVREEVDLCLNAVRTALNYRLISESVNSELKQAVQIQQSLLPGTSPTISGYEIAGFSQPAELVGGDLYDYFEFDEGEFGFCIGDASGHGIPAALMVRDVVTGLRMGIEKEMKMVHTLRKLNSVIYRGAYTSSFISLFYAELEKNGNLFFANAGHPSPLLFTKDTVEELEPTGLIMGAFPQIDISRSFIKFPPGGVLVLYTDGIIERMNNKADLFNVAGIKKVVQGNLHLKAEDIMKKIFKAANAFGKSTRWEDDATLIVIKRNI
ncbi:MAG: PP2C family protein-serine/threonine phosphatase [Ignavibacteria bacterium]|nr:PP2C family protein-serine/threonine phosphatase [Ignavibacteria bacterium]